MKNMKVKYLQQKGISGRIQLDWADLIAFKNTFTESMPQKTEDIFKDKGIDAYHGIAHFAAP